MSEESERDKGRPLPSPSPSRAHHSPTHLRAHAGRSIRPLVVDGADPSSKDLRARLWGVSGRRAVYPQLFLLHSSSIPRAADRTLRPEDVPAEAITFVGDWSAVAAMNERDGTTRELTRALSEVQGGSGVGKAQLAPASTA